MTYSIYCKNKLPATRGGNLWWDDYDRQPVVLFDEFIGQVPISTMKEIHRLCFQCICWGDPRLSEGDFDSIHHVKNNTFFAPQHKAIHRTKLWITNKDNTRVESVFTMCLCYNCHIEMAIHTTKGSANNNNKPAFVPALLLHGSCAHGQETYVIMDLCCELGPVEMRCTYKTA